MTKAELITLVDNTITTNNNEEITGAVLNTVLDAIISNTMNVTDDSKNDIVQNGTCIVSGTALGIVISFKPSTASIVEVFLNGLSERVSFTENFIYIKSSTGVLRASIGEIESTDVVHYNISDIGYNPNGFLYSVQYSK